MCYWFRRCDSKRYNIFRCFPFNDSLILFFPSFLCFIRRRIQKTFQLSYSVARNCCGNSETEWILRKFEFYFWKKKRKKNLNRKNSDGNVMWMCDAHDFVGLLFCFCKVNNGSISWRQEWIKPQSHFSGVSLLKKRFIVPIDFFRFDINKKLSDRSAQTRQQNVCRDGWMKLKSECNSVNGIVRNVQQINWYISFWRLIRDASNEKYFTSKLLLNLCTCEKNCVVSLKSVATLIEERQ